MKALCHMVESNIRSPKSLGVTSESYGSLLSPVLLSKLPADTWLVLSRKVTEDDCNLDGLLKVMEDEIEARECVGASQPKSSEKSSPTATSLVAEAILKILILAIVSKLINTKNSTMICYVEHPSAIIKQVPPLIRPDTWDSTENLLLQCS